MFATQSPGSDASALSKDGAMITVIGGQLFRDIRAAFGVLDRDFLGALGSGSPRNKSPFSNL